MVDASLDWAWLEPVITCMPAIKYLTSRLLYTVDVRNDKSIINSEPYFTLQESDDVWFTYAFIPVVYLISTSPSYVIKMSLSQLIMLNM